LELTEDLRGTFVASVQELAEGAPLRTDQYWEALDASHYDLNTCLRESVVLFKCFLQALPLEQLPEF